MRLLPRRHLIVSAKALLDSNPSPTRAEIAAGARRQYLPLRLA